MTSDVRAYEEKCRAITVVNGYDAGHFFVIEHKHPQRTAVTLAITSSFGAFGHHWSHFGERSAAEALSSLDFDYAMNKLAGDQLRIFDFDKALKYARAQLIEMRREKTLTKDEAASIWMDIEGIDSSSSADLFWNELAEIFGKHFFEREMWNSGESMVYNPQCVGLWKDLWPGFIELLKKEPAST